MVITTSFFFKETFLNNKTRVKLSLCLGRQQGFDIIGRWMDGWMDGWMDR